MSVQPATIQPASIQPARLSGLGAASAPWLAKPGFAWPGERAVHLVARDIRRRDAVGEFCLQIRDLLFANGVSAHLHAENWDGRETPEVRAEAGLAQHVLARDLIFFHLSTEDPALPAIADMPCRKLLYFHGITPPAYLEAYDRAAAERSSAGIAQIAWARKFDRLLANSRIMAEVLRQHEGAAARGGIVVCPPVMGIRGWSDVVPEETALPQAERFILFVGSLAPHKAVHRLLLAFRALALRDRRTGLVIVGPDTIAAYGRELGELQESIGKEVGERILFMRDIAMGALRNLYAKAALFVTLSEHEGFCVPVVEAMQSGLPVMAGGDRAISELLGCVGCLPAADDPAVIASAMSRLLEDSAWRRDILDRQQARLAPIAEATNGAPIWQALESVLKLDARSL